MQIIESNVLSVQAMTNEDSSYPKENAITRQPKQIAKSTSTSTKILFSSTQRITNFALFNVSAETGSLKVLDLNEKTNVTGTDLSFSGSVISSTSTDLSVFSDGDTIAIINSDLNNGTYTVSGTPTGTSLTVSESFTTESAGASITISVFNDSDLSEDIDIDFSFCKSYTDYFQGDSYFIDKYFTSLNATYNNCIIQLELIGTLPSIGLIFGGLARSYGISQYGSGAEIEDNSIFSRTANGSLNLVNRTVNFNFNCQVSCSRSESQALLDLYRFNNKSEKVFLIKEDSQDGLQNAQFLYYGKLQKKPRMTINRPDRVGYTINISSIGGYKS